MGGTWDAPEEDAAQGVWFEFSCALAQGADPCPAPKSLKVGEILNNVGGFGDGQHSRMNARGDDIVNSESMVVEGARPELHGHVGTGKDGLHCICNQAVSLLGCSILAG